MTEAAVQFSVIVPTFNRPDRLSDCLDALSVQTMPKDQFEVIVVDDGGNVDLEAVIRQYSDRLHLQLVHQENSGPGTARNRGARSARGRYLAFTDDDCRPFDNWLSLLSEKVSRMPETMIGGRLVNLSGDNVYAGTSQLILDLVYDLYNAVNDDSHFFSACNLAVSRDLFWALGGFDERFRISEDREFCNRWSHAGRALHYFPEARVSHQDHIHSLRGFCKRYFAYGRGAYRFHRLKALSGTGSMQGEVKFHLKITNWLLYPFRQTGVRRPVIVAALLVLWQFVNALGFVFEMVHSRLNVSARQSLEGVPDDR